VSYGTGDLVSRIYGGFRGVDFRGEDINIVRSPDSLNVWKDYKEVDSIRTRPGMVLQTAFDAPIYGIFFYNDTQLVHSGNKLYKVKDGVKTELYSGLKEGVSNSFTFENVWYFKDGKHYLQYDGTTIKEVDGYVPTTSIGRKPSGGGSTFEDVNMLQPRRINTFLADGGSFDFVLDTMNIDTDYPPIVMVDDVVQTSGYTVDYAKGLIKFTKAPDKPKTDGRDNVSIEFRKTIQKYKAAIENCTLLQVFDNRVFFSGNEDFPNVIWHCSLNDPSYVSDLDYYREGLDSAKVRGLVAGNNALWVFREPSQANTTVFYHTPTIDATYGKIYPSTHSSITTGCVGRAVNFNDDIVFFSDRGMEGISGDVTTEQAVAHRSSLVDRKMLAEADYKNMVLEEWEGYLCIFIGDKVYLADSRTAFNNENHIEYEFFFWQLEKKITCSQVSQGILYLGTEDGVYTMTDFDCDVESWWTTPKDRFSSPNKLKTTSKRGSVVEAKGDIQVYVKTNKEDWALVGTFNDIEDAFVCRIKKKKWKDIQMKFYSKKRFSLETATLESYIGGFVKRL
jgi:hypothetical protein